MPPGLTMLRNTFECKKPIKRKDGGKGSRLTMLLTLVAHLAFSSTLVSPQYLCSTLDLPSAHRCGLVLAALQRSTNVKKKVLSAHSPYIALPAHCTGHQVTLYQQGPQLCPGNRMSEEGSRTFAPANRLTLRLIEDTYHKYAKIPMVCLYNTVHSLLNGGVIYQAYPALVNIHCHDFPCDSFTGKAHTAYVGGATSVT